MLLSEEQAKFWESRFMKCISDLSKIQNQYDALEAEIQEFLKQTPKPKNSYKISECTRELSIQRDKLYKEKRTKEVRKNII